MRLGLDLGGTNMVAGIVDENYNIISKCSLPTGAKRSDEEILFDMYKVSCSALDAAGLDFDDIPFWGIGMPSCINPQTGNLVHANCFGWRNFPIFQRLEKFTKKTIFIENDANCAAYGEVLAGCGKLYSNALLLTLGTGVGSGIIINKKIFSGGNHTGAELGHTKLVHNGKTCSCGKKGCFEMYASASALVAQTKSILELNPNSIITELAILNNNILEGRIIFEAAKYGDKIARLIINQYCDYLADGIASFVSIFRPEAVILGGGISNAGEQLLSVLKPKVFERTFASAEIGVPQIICAQLKNDAGIIGAAFLKESDSIHN